MNKSTLFACACFALVLCGNGLRAEEKPDGKAKQQILEIKKKLDANVSLEFKDTPLAEAVEFLRHSSQVTMIVNPAVWKGDPPAINFKAKDMKTEKVLEWILKLAELDYTIAADGVHIHKPKTK